MFLEEYGITNNDVQRKGYLKRKIKLMNLYICISNHMLTQEKSSPHRSSCQIYIPNFVQNFVSANWPPYPIEASSSTGYEHPKGKQLENLKRTHSLPLWQNLDMT